MRRPPAGPKHKRTNKPRGHAGAPEPALHFASWIIFQDEHLVAVNKPAGVLSQGGEGAKGKNLVDLAREHYKLTGIGVLHRIDRNVSGLVLIAKTPQAARALGLQIQHGSVERVYRAVIRGQPTDDSFRIDAWLRKDPRTNEVTARAATNLGADRESFREASTDVRVVSRFNCPLGRCAALDVRPITGRSHQIRAHLTFAGFPLVGDPKYGVPAQGLHRPLLHARSMTFRHPSTDDLMTLEAPIPWTDRSLTELAAVSSQANIPRR